MKHELLPFRSMQVGSSGASFYAKAIRKLRIQVVALGLVDVVWIAAVVALEPQLGGIGAGTPIISLSIMASTSYLQYVSLNKPPRRHAAKYRQYTMAWANVHARYPIRFTVDVWWKMSTIDHFRRVTCGCSLSLQMSDVFAGMGLVVRFSGGGSTGGASSPSHSAYRTGASRSRTPMLSGARIRAMFSSERPEPKHANKTSVASSKHDKPVSGSAPRGAYAGRVVPASGEAC